MAIVEALGLGQEINGIPILKDINLRIERRGFRSDRSHRRRKDHPAAAARFARSPDPGTDSFRWNRCDPCPPGAVAARRRMAYVQQKPIVFSMSVFDNVATGLRFRHQSGEKIRRKVDQALELVGMSNYRDREARTLSGGEMQRVAIARAFVTEPEVLLLDEPTANLDPVSISRIEKALERIIGGRRISVIMATHDLAQGRRLGDRIGVLIRGELLQAGPPEEVFRSPKDEQIAAFVSAEGA